MIDGKTIMMATVTLIIFGVMVWGYFTLASELETTNEYEQTRCFPATGSTTECDINIEGAKIIRILRNDSTTVPPDKWSYSGSIVTITES